MTRRIVAPLLVALAALPLPARAANTGDPSLQRLRLRPAAGTSFKIVAEYDNAGVTCEANKRKPLRARYAGTLEVVRAGDGSLALVNELTFQEYLEGLAEVPRSWPAETLKAQVIAARSYALYHLRRGGGTTIGYDLCSTDACQVYRGLQVSEGAFGDAWQRAVRQTAGRVLLYGGEPIEAFYFSTSWGRTVSNTEGFGSSTPLPYLKPASGEDDDAPLAHWHVEIPLGDLGPILRAGGVWSGGVITQARVDGSSLVVSDGGSSAAIPLIRFRRAANNQADCLFPTRYPPKRSDGNRLPETIPSPHLSIVVRDGKVVIDGRGWGHGVGMSQYGARSLGERGRGASDILAHFYGGLRPSSFREPGALRVLLAEDSIRLTVEADGPFTARGPNGEIGLGRRFQVRGGGTMQILRAGSITPVLSVNPLGPEIQRATTGGVASVSYVLPSSAKVRALLFKDGREIARGDEVSQTSGPNTASVALVDATGVPIEPGVYDVGLEASDGIDRVRADPVTVQVMPIPPPVASAGTAPAREEGGQWLAIGITIGVVAFLIAVAALVMTVLRRRAARLSRT